MKKMKKGTVYTVQAALIAAIYAALTYAVAPLSFGATQFRISEALTVLPVFTPAAIPGLAIGCIIANIGSPYGPIDILLGTVATVLAALATRLTRNIKIKNIPLLSFIFPTVFNGIIIGAEIMMFTPRSGRNRRIFHLGFGSRSRRDCCVLHTRNPALYRT